MNRVAYSNLEDIAEARITDRTIRKMYKFIDAAKTDEKFQKLVYSVLNTRMRGEWKQYRREAEVLLQWVKQAVDYRRDPVNVELVQDVWATLDRRRADCDDFVVLLGGSLETTGTPVRIVTVSTRPDKQPSHVYLEAYLDGRWEPMDAIIQWSTVGWRPTDGVTDKKVWTRKDVGLSGYEENPDMSGFFAGLGEFLNKLFSKPRPINGLGMHSSMPDGWTDDRYNTRGGGPWEGGFAERMYVVPMPGIPNDVSETFAPGIPGTAIIAKRIAEPTKYVNSVADDHTTLRADDPTIPYPQKLPIESWRTPQELDYSAQRSRIPMRFNPDAWTGRVEDWTLSPSYMMPQQTVSLEEKMIDIAGLGRYGRNGALAHVTPSWDDYTMAGYTGMGSFFDDLVAKAKALVEGGIATVQGAAAMVTGGAKPVPTMAPPPSGKLPGWVVPAGVVAVVAVIGYTMMGRGRGRRVRRNPGRLNLRKLMLPAVAVGAWVVLSKKNGAKPATAPANPTMSPDYTATTKGQSVIDMNV